MTLVTPIHVRLPTKLYTAAQQAAADDDRTLSYVVRKALETYLQDLGYSIDKP